MTEKIQLTKEQADELYFNIFFESFHDPTEFKNKLKEFGYLKKSYLHQKVEEVEPIISEFETYTRGTLIGGETCIRIENTKIIKLFDLIKLFKEKYPEDFRWCLKYYYLF